jgi:indole-3-glycerol phosphate synthase
MRAIKERELPEVHRLLERCIGRQRARYAFPPESLESGIISEIKKASPSEGGINDVPPAAQATRYGRGGACALSVLTDGNFFGGSWADLWSVADATDLPLLCKEFIYFEEQIDLADCLGADMVLLIARALEPERLRALYGRALRLGLVPLVEVHSADELPDVLELGPRCILVNSRNLETLAIDDEAAARAFEKIPEGVRGVWASGIGSAEDVAAVRDRTGARFFLVGTSLMKSKDPEKVLKEMGRVC